MTQDNLFFGSYLEDTNVAPEEDTQIDSTIELTDAEDNATEISGTVKDLEMTFNSMLYGLDKLTVLYAFKGELQLTNMTPALASLLNTQPGLESYMPKFSGNQPEMEAIAAMEGLANVGRKIWDFLVRQIVRIGGFLNRLVHFYAIRTRLIRSRIEKLFQLAHGAVEKKDNDATYHGFAPDDLMTYSKKVEDCSTVITKASGKLKSIKAGGDRATTYESVQDEVAEAGRELNALLGEKPREKELKKSNFTQGIKTYLDRAAALLDKNETFIKGLAENRKYLDSMNRAMRDAQRANREGSAQYYKTVVAIYKNAIMIGNKSIGLYIWVAARIVKSVSAHLKNDFISRQDAYKQSQENK